MHAQKHNTADTRPNDKHLKDGTQDIHHGADVCSSQQGISALGTIKWKLGKAPDT